jgi:hypothetical protein
VKVENCPPDGMVPFKLLYATLKLDRKFSFVSEDGMPPVRLLCDKSKDSKLDMPDSSLGMIVTHCVMNSLILVISVLIMH